MSKVGIVMGSDSDLSVMKAAMEMLEKFGIEYDVLIAGAGGAAHLPGMAAAVTPIPVIGVPIHTKSLGGVDSLYSIVQMPAGIPVATVAINGAKNAAILAAKIISVREPEIRQKIKDFAEGLKDEVLAKKTKIEKVGYKTYLEEMN